MIMIAATRPDSGGASGGLAVPLPGRGPAAARLFFPDSSLRLFLRCYFLIFQIRHACALCGALAALPKPAMDHAKECRHKEQRGQGCEQQPANDRTTQR